MLRFLHLNIYSFLIVFAGILTVAVPLYEINKWFFLIQAIIAINLFMLAARLFSAWKHKLREIEILKKRNGSKFRPATFDVYMQAPCGKLVVRQALKDLNKIEEYRNLLKLQKPLLERMKNNCVPSKTVIYINEGAL